ncbi:hypothetical protein [Daejeonella sp.]|uniref:alpha-2-macroglobulin family protein n=1 Tax=Daejeonella sp. TaxID=2805397 RepID=UPI003C748D71
MFFAPCSLLFFQFLWNFPLNSLLLSKPESTKDASTNFFISYLRKGVYVFEYPLRVSHSGNFSNGITSLQSMYAPEFTTHSEGKRIQVK